MSRTGDDDEYVIVSQSLSDLLSVILDGEAPSGDQHPLQPFCDQLDGLLFGTNVVGKLARDDGDEEYAAIAARIAADLDAAKDGYCALAALEIERCTCGRCASRPRLVDSNPERLATFSDGLAHSIRDILDRG